MTIVTTKTQTSNKLHLVLHSLLLYISLFSVFKATFNLFRKSLEQGIADNGSENLLVTSSTVRYVPAIPYGSTVQYRELMPVYQAGMLPSVCCLPTVCCLI